MMNGASMVYISKWEQLSDALVRVVGSGISEDEAKRDICNALADGKIRVRIRLPLKPDWILHENVFVPPQLHPDDFCWILSRWQIINQLDRFRLGLGQDLPEGLRLWEASRIELCREDVTNVLCTDLEKTLANPTVVPRDKSIISTSVTSKLVRRYPKRERAQRAISELYPTGVPDQVVLSDKELSRDVMQHLKKRLGNLSEQSLPSDDTILRAAGRRN
jgi:hypothetical protein